MFLNKIKEQVKEEYFANPEQRLKENENRGIRVIYGCSILNF